MELTLNKASGLKAHPEKVIAVANELDTAARQLAACIDSLTGLTPEQRCELRGLPMAMMRWKDALDPERAPVVSIEIVRRLPMLARETWR